MKVLKILESNINTRHIDEIVECLRDGGLIVYPTDTVYALGCDALNNQAIERICALKEMKSAKTNLSIICNDISEVAQYARFDNTQFKLMKSYLPGAFTFIFPALSKLPKAFKGRRTVGIRIPDNAIARAIVDALGRPILTTSIAGRDEDYRCEPELIDCTDGDPVVVRQGKGEF